MKRLWWTGLAGLVLWAGFGCQEDVTAVLDSDLLPVGALTVEVSLPMDEFTVGGLDAWGGYGQPYELNHEVLARGYKDGLDARVLNSWFPLPVSVTVPDSTGVYQTDSTLTFVGGTIVARFDTLNYVLEDSVTLTLGAVQQDWDYRTTRWNVAVDSVGDQQLWDGAGGGQVVPIATAVWDPLLGDSVIFELDSAGVALWSDTVAAHRGARIDAVTEGSLLNLTGVEFNVSTRPSVHPDTIVPVGVSSRSRTFIYDPVPEPPEGEIRVGGVPAWRTIMTFELPETLDGPPELCAQLQCPVKLTPEGLVSAALVLTTKAPPPAFQPTDSLWLDARPVLEPSRMPKSPLGASLVGLIGTQVAPEVFGEEAGVEVEIPLGQFMEGLIAEMDDPELDLPHSVALLSYFEPLSIYFAAFEGPESAAGPRLRLVMTFSEDMRIR